MLKKVDIVIILFFTSLICACIAKQETKAADMNEVFKSMDKDDDGEVTKDEIAKFLQSKGLGMAPDSPDFKQIVDSFLTSYDGNKDDKITKKEFTKNKQKKEQKKKDKKNKEEL